MPEISEAWSPMRSISVIIFSAAEISLRSLRNGLLLQQELEAKGLDVPLLLVDFAVKGDCVIRRFDVLLNQRFAGGLNRVLNQRAHFQ